MMIGTRKAGSRDNGNPRRSCIDAGAESATRAAFTTTNKMSGQPGKFQPRLRRGPVAEARFTLKGRTAARIAAVMSPQRAGLPKPATRVPLRENKGVSAHESAEMEFDK